MAPNPHRRWPRVLAIVVAVLVVLGFVGLQLLDGILTSKAQAEAATLSEALGRPVRVGSVAAKLLTGLGVRVSGLEIGAGPGEPLPLLQIDQVAVRVALLRAIFSAGKDIEVRSVEVVQPVVNVIRLRDGTTNVERVQEALAKQPKETAKPSSEPRDLSAVRVGHAAIVDGRIKLLDQSTPTARELAISDLDITVANLRAGQPLELTVKAAVLATAQNFELRMTSAPLPPSLQPTPVRLVLKVQPIDLAPLAPFVSKSIGLLGGRLDADWTSALGAAVPGGSGPTELKGSVHARGLRFAGAEGGKALDVALESDVSGNAEKGDLEIRTLRLDLGPAGIRGTGRVRGLTSETPSVEGLEVTGHDLDPAILAAYCPPLRRSLKGQIAGPIGLSVKVSGTQTAAALALTLDFTPVRLDVPDTLRKAAGAPMTVVARVRGGGAGALRFESEVQLAGVDLRPGLTLDKAPGQTLDLSARGSYRGGKTTRVALDAITLHLLADTISGKASAELSGEGARRTTAFDVSLTSPRLDADRLLLTTDAKAPPPPPPPADPRRFDGYRGKVHVQIATVVYKKTEMKNLLAELSMTDDLLKVDRFGVDAFGGQLRADGTTVRLGPASHPFDARAQARGIQLAQALDFGGKGKALSGSFGGDVALAGAGTTVDALGKTLTGTIDGKLIDGALLGKDLVASVAGPLAKALPFASRALQSDGKTSLGPELAVHLAVDKGTARLKQPLAVNLPQAAVTLGGSAQVDGQLNLAGTVALTPSTIQTLTGGRVKPPENIPLALQLTGPAWSPRVEGLDVKPAAFTIAKLAGASLAGSLLGGKGGALQGILGAGGGGAVEAAPKGQGDPKAQDEATRIRQKAQEEAKKKLQGLFGH